MKLLCSMLRIGRSSGRSYVLIAAVAAATVGGIGPSLATDGQLVLDLGIVSWLDYRKQQLLARVVEVTIQDRRIESFNTTTTIYQPVIFENRDQVSHRLIFLPDTENYMEIPYTSAVIRAKERWGAEFQASGVFPYHCTVHPDEQGTITVTR